MNAPPVTKHQFIPNTDPMVAMIVPQLHMVLAENLLKSKMLVDLERKRHLMINCSSKNDTENTSSNAVAMSVDQLVQDLFATTSKKKNSGDPMRNMSSDRPADLSKS
ncbi:hypothetical protein DPMN_116254 [Dreissena polymorpha]|uniref:Uncharacterized protein n=1 Tax=Dreissena polymorpha TaxID=45954 RepID=A0A9D4KMR5_DREPO|nr:hypothetical protein DPMN_116254 [Dreissena polymorpha]